MCLKRFSTHTSKPLPPAGPSRDLFCRLPLSKLFYRLEAVHLGDLMRLIEVGAELKVQNLKVLSMVSQLFVFGKNTLRTRGRV